jgi:hypothetical protein
VFASLDNSLVASVNRLAAYLQQDLGLTLPVILRQAATATIMATLLAIFATWLMRDFLFLVLVLVFGGVTIASFARLLQRYTRDAEKDWTSDLARDYAVRAIGATEGQRRMREIGLLFSLIALSLSVVITQFRALDLVDLTMIGLVLSTLGHMYLSCAEPKPPGTRRRQARLTPALQGAR